MKILVTGGAGFIGSHIAKQLLEAGHEVVVYDIAEATESRSDGATVIKGDVRDSKTLVEALQNVDAVIHMASFISVEESVKNPLKYMENNVLGTASLLTAMRQAGVKKIVFSSSATVYGEPKSLPALEDAPLSAANPYAASKIAMEAICEAFYKQSLPSAGAEGKTDESWDVVILRYFNPYGPGENHDPETHAIPNFVKAGLEKKPIPLYWKGEQIRDFIYVEDLAAAHIAVLGDSGGRGDSGNYQVYNVGTEVGTKIIDVVNILSDILGYKIQVEDKGERKGDVMANYASSEKLKQATGWEAKVGLKEGLAKTVDYFRSKLNY